MLAKITPRVPEPSDFLAPYCFESKQMTLHKVQNGPLHWSSFHALR